MRSAVAPRQPRVPPSSGSRIVGICVPFLLSVSVQAAEPPCPGNARYDRVTDDYYFTASSLTGAVGDVVAVDLSLTIERRVPDYNLGGFVLIGCYDDSVAELVADPLYSPEFDSAVYLSFFQRYGEGDPTSFQAVRPGGGLGFALFGGFRNPEVFRDGVNTPLATLFFRLKGPPGSVAEMRFCDDEFRHVLGGACESNLLLHYSHRPPRGAEKEIHASSTRHVAGALTVVEGPATHPDLPAIPPTARVYPTAPAPEDAAVLFELSGAVASPGAKGIPVDLHVTSALEFSGFSVSVKFPATALAVARVEEHTRAGVVHIDNDSGHLGLFMGNSRRRVGAEGERVRLATLYFDLKDAADGRELVSRFEAKQPYTNWLVIHHEGGVIGDDLPVAAEVEPLQVLHGLLRIQNEPTSLGDVNLDYTVDLTDAVALLNGLFLGDDLVLCPGAADANTDGKVDLGDPIAILNHLFRGGSLAAGEVYCGRGTQ